LSSRALVCKDLKKVVALSTLRQLSFIVVALALIAPYVAVCHLIRHALFKSGLFLAVGVVIHYGFRRQEVRTSRLDSLRGRRLLTLGLPLIALSGVPSLSGFSTKELIIVARMREGRRALLAFGLILGAILTLAYSWRVVLRGLL
jgi:NADH:ubiquinone oxidoreductase subunit 5 (subunit L)/multisubunit Na+/H+ antiporter MnhA subunit